MAWPGRIQTEVKARPPSSSLDDGTIALTSFMRGKPPCSAATGTSSVRRPDWLVGRPGNYSRFVPRASATPNRALEAGRGQPEAAFPDPPRHQRAMRATRFIPRSGGPLPLFSPHDELLIAIARSTGARSARGRARRRPRHGGCQSRPNPLKGRRFAKPPARPQRRTRPAWHHPCERLNFAETSRWTVSDGKDGAGPTWAMRKHA